MDPRQLLTADELATLLGVRKRYVLQLPIPRVRLGHRTLRFRLADIDRYLNGAADQPPR